MSSQISESTVSSVIDSLSEVRSVPRDISLARTIPALSVSVWSALGGLNSSQFSMALYRFSPIEPSWEISGSDLEMRI